MRRRKFIFFLLEGDMKGGTDAALGMAAGLSNSASQTSSSQT
jgi:hypothetical protein